MPQKANCSGKHDRMELFIPFYGIQDHPVQLNPDWGLTRPNDLLDLDPGSLNFTGELMHSLAGVFICVGIHVEL